MAFPTSEPPLNTAKAYPDPALKPPALDVPTPKKPTAKAQADSESVSDPPVKKISSEALRTLGQRFNTMFMQYVSDRRIVELRWLANQRQYLGLYDPEVEKSFSPNRSKAYPKLTRTKCISVLARIMNLMFQGNERNWEIHAAPWPEITAQEIRDAITLAQEKDQSAGVPTPDPSDSFAFNNYVMEALDRYADLRANKLATLIDDQLQELGGHQALDYVALNRAVIRSGIIYGLGVLRGPFVRKSETVTWKVQKPPSSPQLSPSVPPAQLGPSGPPNSPAPPGQGMSGLGLPTARPQMNGGAPPPPPTTPAPPLPPMNGGMGAPTAGPPMPGALPAPIPVVKPIKQTVFKPYFEFLPVWDFYPDLSAKTLQGMDGYFVRHVMSRTQVKELGSRPDFFPSVIDSYLQRYPVGNYRAQPFEQELRAMGVKVNVNEMKTETMKYEVMVWHGAVDGRLLQEVGVEVPADSLSDYIDAEIWMIDANVIGARLNPWEDLAKEMPSVPTPPMIHTFLFDEDDTSPVGFGLPQAIRDSQMMVAAATRMLLDNASVVCGPNIELNTDLLRLDQDLSAISSYKVWYREGSGPEAQWPAVRNIQIDAHLDSLLKIVELGLRFADSETFVGPATGGDQERVPSEPMRTAAGASMLRGDAALPFKDIIRSFDTFTQSLINSMVLFNRVFNPTQAPDGDYDVIARGATSLMAKELRGIQADSLVQTLKPEQMIHVDERKLTEAQIKARDMDDILVTEDEASRRQQAQAQSQQEMQEQQNKLMEANLRKILSDAFKNIAQGQKNTANADAQLVETALGILEKGVQDELSGTDAAGAQPVVAPVVPPAPEPLPVAPAGGGLAEALATGAVDPGAIGPAPVPVGPPELMPEPPGQGIPQ
jgi:hypothetical protein